MASNHLNLIVVDGNAPWVRSLFAAMQHDTQVSFLRPVSVSAAFRSPRSTFASWRKSPLVVENTTHLPKIIPGWKYTTQWSARILARQIRSLADRSPVQSVVVYTLPHYAPVAERVTEILSVYFAFDPYDSYTGWNRDWVLENETQLFKRCLCSFAISTALSEDFRRRTSIPVFVQPNGIPSSALNVLASRPPRPSDLPTGMPIALCVGQIGEAYDWQLIESVTARLPELRFVFVGPLLQMSDARRQAADRVFEKQNVLYLGWRDPGQLADYLWNSEVLFSPLAINAANNRRSLLRMFDYIATDRPIVATPIESSAIHERFVKLASSAEDYASALSAAVASSCCDEGLLSRRQYLELQTWEHRAQLFLNNLRSAVSDRETKQHAV